MTLDINVNPALSTSGCVKYYRALLTVFSPISRRYDYLHDHDHNYDRYHAAKKLLLRFARRCACYRPF